MYLVVVATYPRNMDQIWAGAPRPCLSCYGLSYFDFEFRNLKSYEHQRRGISLSTENFVCCDRNATFFAWKISRSFADHPSKILINKVEKFYIGLSMITQKNRRVRISSKNLILFAIRCQRTKHLNTSIKYRRFQEKCKKYMLAGILLHIIKLKTTYSHESHHYSGCNQSLTSRASTWPISKKVKPAI